MANWERFEFDDFDKWFGMPDKPGCYAIYCDGRLAYIGQALNVRKRIQSYDLDYSYGNSIFTPFGSCRNLYVKIRWSKRFGDWAMIELRMIRRLQPPFNCVGGTRKRNTKVDRHTPVHEQLL